MADQLLERDELLGQLDSAARAGGNALLEALAEFERLGALEGQ
jgi:hypothetical protein